MGQLTPMGGTEIIAEAAEATADAGAALIRLAEKIIEEHPAAVIILAASAAIATVVVSVGVSKGLAKGIPEFAKNSWFRWSSGESPSDIS
ncbi:hypothetical protein [Sphingomonas sp. 22176]|uniref:hypothetical protein n=1 Tax=Sphingomonas sp. 22176 TaxID=3453884 RepID=UPI003F8535DB